MPEIDFLLIGAQKAGTTSLFEYLRRHPQVHMPPEKDIAFFNRDSNFERGWDWYVNTVLRNAPRDAVCGEASTYYMSGTPFGDLIRNERQQPAPATQRADRLEDVVPGRIKRSVPDVRLISILRDPIERAHSHHRMMVLERAESRSFDDAIAELLAPSALENARAFPTRTNNYIVNGEYHRVLAGFERAFPRDQLMVTFSDELARQPAPTLRALFEFIGVAPDFVPDNLSTRYRVAADAERVRGLNLYAWQERIAGLRTARRLWRALPYGLRESVDRAYTVMSYRTQMWNARRGATGEALSPDTRLKLREHFAPDGLRLAGALDRDIPWLSKWAKS